MKGGIGDEWGESLASLGGGLWGVKVVGLLWGIGELQRETKRVLQIRAPVEHKTENEAQTPEEPRSYLEEAGFGQLFRWRRRRGSRVGHTWPSGRPGRRSRNRCGLLQRCSNTCVVSNHSTGDNGHQASGFALKLTVFRVNLADALAGMSIVATVPTEHHE